MVRTEPVSNRQLLSKLDCSILKIMVGLQFSSTKDEHLEIAVIVFSGYSRQCLVMG